MDLNVSLQQLHYLLPLCSLYHVVFSLISRQRYVERGISAEVLFDLSQVKHLGHLLIHRICSYDSILVDSQQHWNQFILVLHLLLHKVKPVPERLQSPTLINVLLGRFSLHLLQELRIILVDLSITIAVLNFSGDLFNVVHSRLVYSLLHFAGFSILLRKV